MPGPGLCQTPGETRDYNAEGGAALEQCAQCWGCRRRADALGGWGRSVLEGFLEVVMLGLNLQ